jgi:hypothetical protein
MRFRRRSQDVKVLDQELLVATTGADLELGEHVLSEHLGIGIPRLR